MTPWAEMPEPVQLRKRFLETVGFDMEPGIDDVQRLYRDGWSSTDLAAALHLNLRTVQRWVTASTPCPGDRCATLVSGGGLCSFCRGAA